MTTTSQALTAAVMAALRTLFGEPSDSYKFARIGEQAAEFARRNPDYDPDWIIAAVEEGRAQGYQKPERFLQLLESSAAQNRRPGTPPPAANGGADREAMSRQMAAMAASPAYQERYYISVRAKICADPACPWAAELRRLDAGAGVAEFAEFRQQAAGQEGAR